MSNLDRYERDLDALIANGDILDLALQSECFPDTFRTQVKNAFKDDAKTILKGIPSFKQDYQKWYSEAKILIRQLLPDRLEDFVRYYEKPKHRRSIDFESYTIEDYLQGLEVTRQLTREKVVGPDAAIPQFRQQLAILKSVKARFKSSLFDIRQLVQADLFDSDLDAAKELAKNKFARAAGGLAGVVLEKHLAQVCDNHSVKITKKLPTIADLNNTLKDAGVTDTAQWRFIQHLGDLRNLCDHNKKKDPTQEQVDDLIAGVSKTIKTLF